MITCKTNERKIDEKKKKKSSPIASSSFPSVWFIPYLHQSCPSSRSGHLSRPSVHMFLPSIRFTLPSFLPSFPHSPTLKNVSGFPSFQLGPDPPPLKKLELTCKSIPQVCSVEP